MNLLAKFRETAFSVLPVMGIVTVLGLVVVPPAGTELAPGFSVEPLWLPRFLAGGALLVVGLTVFLLGVDLGISPMGERCGAELTRVPVEDRGVLHDADTPEDYKALLKYHNEQLVRPVLHVSLARETVFFDSRAAMLLQLIDETHSVRTACQRMQMSYSGGWNVIRRLESQLSRDLIRRSQGGAGGGKSSLTDDGRLLLERYEAYSDALREKAGELFDGYFEGLF